MVAPVLDIMNTPRKIPKISILHKDFLIIIYIKGINVTDWLLIQYISCSEDSGQFYNFNKHDHICYITHYLINFNTIQHGFQNYRNSTHFILEYKSGISFALSWLQKVMTVAITAVNSKVSNLFHKIIEDSSTLYMSYN